MDKHGSRAAIELELKIRAAGGDSHRRLRWLATILMAVAILGGCHKHVVPPPAPTATLAVSPDTIQAGHSAKLTWQTTNATDITIDQGVGKVAALGTTIVNPLQTTTYQITAKGQSGTAQASATLTVTPRQ